jgi:hypothetical protein
MQSSHCPIKKEKAIKEALEHFGMIESYHYMKRI